MLRPARLLAPLAAAVLTVLLPATTATASPRAPQVATTVSGAWVVTTPYPSALGSLSGIAAARCGSASRWPEIARANRVTRPELLQIGVRLWVPCATTGTAPAPTPRVSAPRSGWVSPLASYRLSSCFGWRASTNSYHRGLDMAAPKGTTIRAAAAGTVTRVGWIWGGYGISTVIRHTNGTQTRWTHYAHQSSTSVRVGQRVAAGQPIGRVGNTGFVIASRNGDGSHLHFEIATTAGVLKTQINPAPFLRARGVTLRGC